MNYSVTKEFDEVEEELLATRKIVSLKKTVLTLKNRVVLAKIKMKLITNS